MKFNPDNIIIEKTKILEEEDLLDKLLDKLREKIEPYVPKSEDFIDVYGKDYIDKLNNLANILEKNWEYDRLKLPLEKQKKERIRKKIGTIVEYILINQLSGGWLNDEDAEYDVFANGTHKFDDYGITNSLRKGFDLSIEFVHKSDDVESVYAGASIDVTTTKNPGVVRKKFNKIVNIIKSGEAIELLFFENNAETFKGAVPVAPFEFIISEKAIEDLLNKERFGKKEDLENHNIQLSLLLQLKRQAEIFLALSVKYKNNSLLDFYKKILKHINFLIYKKEDYSNDSQVDFSNLKEKYKGLNLMNEILDEIIERENK